MTKIGMAIDPSRLLVVQRRQRRRRRIGTWSIAAFAVLLLVANVALMELRSASTAVDEAALFAEFSAASPVATEGSPTSATGVPAEVEAPVDGDVVASQTAPAAPDDATSEAAPEAQSGTSNVDDDRDPSPAKAPAAAAEPAEAAPAAPTFAIPASGVYAYRTQGYERVSLGGARHDYPERTFALIERQQGCEWTLDHRVVEEKRTVNTFCHDGPEQHVLAYDGWVTFFGQTAESHYTCTGARADRRDTPGATHSSQCTDGSATTDDVTTYLGEQVLVIDGVEVLAMAYQIETKVSGDITGTSSQAVWLRPADGLPLRIERDTETSTYEFGTDVDYVEHAVFELESLNPRS